MLLINMSLRNALRFLCLTSEKGRIDFIACVASFTHSLQFCSQNYCFFLTYARKSFFLYKISFIYAKVILSNSPKQKKLNRIRDKDLHMSDFFCTFAAACAITLRLTRAATSAYENVNPFHMIQIQTREDTGMVR